MLRRLLKEWLFLWYGSITTIYADQIISSMLSTPVVSNGQENITVTPTGAIVISAAGASNYAIRLTGTLQNGKTIKNEGAISTMLDASGGWSSIPLMLNVSSHGNIVNRGSLSSTVEDSQLAYPLYLSRNEVSGTVVNFGDVLAVTRDNSWGVALHVRRNKGLVENEANGVLRSVGRTNSWIYGFATIRNEVGGTLRNLGKIRGVNTGDDGGSTGMYTQYNDGAIINSGLIELKGEGANNTLYGIGVNHNYALIRNSGVIRLHNSAGAESWAFHTDDGNGSVVNDTGALAYGDIHTVGQHFENRGELYLYTTGQSLSDYYHGSTGSVLGIVVDLDNAHHPIYSTLKTRGTVLDEGSQIFVDVRSTLSQQHYLLGQELLGVIQTDNNLTVQGQILVQDNSALLDYRARYDAANLDLIPYRVSSFSRAAERGCNAAALGVAEYLDDYPLGSNPQIDSFVLGLYQLPSLEEVGNALEESIPLVALHQTDAQERFSRLLSTQIPTDPVGDTLVTGKKLWMKVVHDSISRPCTNDYRGYDAKLRGILVGGDGQVAQARLGMALFAGHGKIQSGGLDQDGRFDRYDLIFYGHAPLTRRWQLRMRSGLSRVSSRLSRRLPLLPGKADIRVPMNLFYASVEAYRTFRFSRNLQSNLSLGAFWIHSRMDSVKEENAGDMNVDLDQSSHTALYLDIRSELLYHWDKEWSVKLKGELTYETLQPSFSSRGRFQGYQNGDFPIDLNYRSPWSWQLGLSVIKKFGKDINVALESFYGKEWKAGRNFGVSVQLTWSF